MLHVSKIFEAYVLPKELRRVWNCDKLFYTKLSSESVVCQVRFYPGISIFSIGQILLELLNCSSYSENPPQVKHVNTQVFSDWQFEVEKDYLRVAEVSWETANDPWREPFENYGKIIKISQIILLVFFVYFYESYQTYL